MDVICAILPSQEVEIIHLQPGLCVRRCLGGLTLQCAEAGISSHDFMAFGYCLNNASF